MTDEQEEEKRKKRLEYMRRMLKPITHERAREIASTYTEHMHESVERTRQQRSVTRSDESND